jgi:hypothetical protein
MSRRVLAIAGVVSTLALVVPADAGSISFYNRNGSYAGSAITGRGYTTYTDQRGSFAGSSNTRGNTTTFYDRRGSFAGSTTRTGGR